MALGKLGIATDKTPTHEVVGLLDPPDRSWISNCTDDIHYAGIICTKNSSTES